MNNKPKHFLILKIVGFLGLAVAITGFVLVFTGFNDFESNNFLIGSFLVPFGFIATGIGIAIGFSPEIAKMKAKSTKYIQEQNKEDLTSIASINADISSESVTKTTKAIKKGLTETMYCKHCGAEIDKDSKFCKDCGKEQ